MYQPSTPHAATQPAGKVALFFGLRAGLLLGIAQSIIIIYQNHGSYSPYGALNAPLSVLLWVVAFLGAGILAAKQIGKTSTGTLAGLWAGIVGGLFTAGTLLFELITSYFGYGYDLETIIAIIAGSLLGMIFLVLFAMGAGTGLGALGGLIGQSFFRKTPVAPMPQYQQKEPPQQQSQTKQS
jgi:hypothetical protein